MENNCQKRRQPPITDSVIARLMGLDELSHQRPLHKYQRVLSDGYICKSASIGLRQGSSVFIGSASDTNYEMLQGVKGASGVVIYEEKNNSVPYNYTHQSTSTVKMVIRNKKHAVVSLSNPTSGGSHEDRKAFVRHSEHCAPGNVLRYLQKLDNYSSTDRFHHLGTGYTNNSFPMQSDMADKPCLSSTHVSEFKPNSEKTTIYCGVTRLDLLSRSETGESLKPETGKYCDLAYKELFDNDIESQRCSVVDLNRTMNGTSRQQWRRSNPQDVSRPASKGINYLRNESHALLPSLSGVYYCKNYNNGPHILLCKSSLGQETLKKNFERQKIDSETEKNEVSGSGQTHVRMEGFPKVESSPKYLNLGLGRNGLCTQSCKQSRNFGSSSPLGISRIKVWENDHIENPHDSESETIKESLSTRSDSKMDEEQETLKDRCGSGCEQFLSPEMNSSISQSATSVEVSDCYLSRKGSENNSPDAYAKIIQDEMEDISENNSRPREIELGSGVSMSSHLSCQCRSNDAFTDVEAFNGGIFYKISENQQPESNPGFFSVKDAYSSYSQEVSSTEASFNEFSDEASGYSNCSRVDTPEVQKQLERPIGQQSQFQVFNSESEEAYSEGSEMVVSGNEEEKEEVIADLSYNSGKVHRWLGDDESRSFCYVVDVLDEAGCFKEGSIIDLINSWDCLERPINPLVFEALEKKYGRQPCWQKSDRQLLFDLINSGLTGILKRLLNFHARATPSLQRHFIAGMKRDEVEDLLWKMVISREREKSGDASEKVVEGAMKWWEVDLKDINAICRELEISLFEELVMESISLWFE